MGIRYFLIFIFECNFSLGHGNLDLVSFEISILDELKPVPNNTQSCTQTNQGKVDLLLLHSL